MIMIIKNNINYFNGVCISIVVISFSRTINLLDCIQIVSWLYKGKNSKINKSKIIIFKSLNNFLSIVIKIFFFLSVWKKCMCIMTQLRTLLWGQIVCFDIILKKIISQANNSIN